MASRRAAQRRGSIPLAGSVSGGPTRHGLTTGQIEAMRRAQGGGCAVCGRPLPLSPIVDHDHAEAARHPHPASRGCPRCVRGLLCNDCNLLLGHARDLVSVLEAAIAYLMTWRGRFR